MRSFRYIINKVLGQNSKDDPTQLMQEVGRGVFASDQMPLVRGFKTDKGIFDGTVLGQKAEYLTATKFVLGQDIWEPGNGYAYHLAYESDGNGMNGVIKYWQTPLPTTSGMAYTGTVTNLSAIPTNIVPSFVNLGNGYLLVACGQYGIWKIGPLQNGTLSATAVSGLPASSNIVARGNRLWIAVNDETIIRWTPYNDYERLLPKLEEIEAGTYGVDRRVTLTPQGVGGFVTGMFGCDAYLAVWTNRDMSIIVGNGESKQTSFLRCGKGYGMSGLKSFTYKDNILYWRSDYNGGTILGAVIGAVPAGGKLLTSIGAKEFSLHIFDAAELITSEFVDTPLMDCKVVTAGLCDAKGDFDDTFSSGTTGKIYANTSLNTDKDPGYIQCLSAEAAISYWYDIYTGQAGWTAVMSASPLLSAVFSPTGGGTIRNAIWVHAVSPTGEIIHSSMENLSEGVAWSGYRLYDLPNVINIYIDFRTTNDKLLRIRLGWQNPQTLKKITYTSVIVNTGGGSCGIATIVVTGQAVDTTHITSQVFKVEGLTTDNNALDANSRALGRFYVSYIGTNADGTGLGTATGLNSESFSNVQVRANGTSFNYDATNATLAWQNVTEAQLKTGFDLTTNSQFAPTAGVLYVQYRIPLQVVNGVSPKIDAAGFYFWFGNNLKSINPMGYKDKNLLCCVRDTDLSVVPDKTIVLNNYGGRSTLRGQHVTSFLNYRDKIYSAQGLRVAEYGEGIENRQTASDTAVPMERRIRYPRISLAGQRVYPKTCNIKVDKYDLSTATPESSQAMFNALVHYSSGSTYRYSGKRCYEAYDGTVCSLVWADGSCVSLYLLRSNRLTGNTTAKLLHTSGNAVNDFSMEANANKTKLYILAAAGETGAEGKYLKYWTYDLVTDTLSAGQTIVTAESARSFRSCSLALVGTTMHIVYNDGSGTENIIYHRTSTNYEDTNPTWSSATTVETVTATGLAVRAYKDYAGYLSIIFGANGSAGQIYARQYTTSWQSAVNLRSPAATNNVSVVSHNGRDHCFIWEGTSIYVWSSAGTWEETATITAGLSPTLMDCAPYGSGSIAVVWSDGTNLDYSTGFNDTFTAKDDGSIPDTTNYACMLSKNNQDRVYMISQTSNSSLYTYYLSMFYLHTDPVGSLKCVATTNNGSYTVFERTTAVSSPITLPVNGRFPNIGNAEYLDVELIGYGDTKITASEFGIEYTED